MELESIKAIISLKSFITNEFSIENLEISTKSLKINDVLFFAKSFYKTPQIIFLEKFIRIKGYLITEIKLEFDSMGNLKDNYTVQGFIKDTKVGLPKDYNIEKLNFVFKISKNNFIFEDIKLKLNGLNIHSNNIVAKKKEKYHIIKGNFNNDTLELNN